MDRARSPPGGIIDEDDDSDGQIPATPSDGGRDAPNGSPAPNANDEVVEDGRDEEEEEEEDDDALNHGSTPRHPYPHLREIGHLASWTVSTHKQRYGVAELRHPSTSHFWQSDGPQPHTLTIHFFKRVTICHMRLHVDHELDESYTPTLVQIWAGTAHHDLQLVTDMPLESPKGWLDVDLSCAGGPSEFVQGEEVDDQAVLDSLSLPYEPSEQVLLRRRRRLEVGRGPTLRCFIVQVRILENHQNGKDTHLRGFQVFAKDREASGRSRMARPARLMQAAPSMSKVPPSPSGARKKQSRKSVTVAGIKEADWMGEVTIR